MFLGILGGLMLCFKEYSLIKGYWDLWAMGFKGSL